MGLSAVGVRAGRGVLAGYRTGLPTQPDLYGGAAADGAAACHAEGAFCADFGED